MSNAKHFWPHEWLEAAMQAGFAQYKGFDEWEFINDKIRDMLAEFGSSLVNNERERCAKLADSCCSDGTPMLHNLANAIRERGEMR